MQEHPEALGQVMEQGKSYLSTHPDALDSLIDQGAAALGVAGVSVIASHFQMSECQEDVAELSSHSSFRLFDTQDQVKAAKAFAHSNLDSAAAPAAPAAAAPAAAVDTAAALAAAAPAEAAPAAVETVPVPAS